MRTPTHGPVTQQKRDVTYCRTLNVGARLLEQRRDPFDGEHLSGKMREQYGLIAGARSDLEHLLVASELEQLQILRMNRRLRDGLSAADRKWRVLVRLVPQSGRHE